MLTHVKVSCVFESLSTMPVKLLAISSSPLTDNSCNTINADYP